MKKLIFLFVTSIVAIGGISMMSSNEENVEPNSPLKTCEYTFKISCKNSSGTYEVFNDTYRSMYRSEAEKVMKNRYPNCNVSSPQPIGQNCK